MSNILVIQSSVSGQDSVSRHLVDAVVRQLRLGDPDAAVTERDVGRQPIPHLTTETLAGVRGVPVSGPEVRTRALSDQLISEFRAADTIVIGAPMYNFSIPTGLRAWFDHILRAGETFSYTEAGPKGLLGGRRAVIVESRGGLYSEGPAQASDFQEPYLRHLLGFMGVTDLSFIHAEKIGYGADARQAAIEGALNHISELSRLQAEFTA